MSFPKQVARKARLHCGDLPRLHERQSPSRVLQMTISAPCVGGAALVRCPLFPERGEGTTMQMRSRRRVGSSYILRCVYACLCTSSTRTRGRAGAGLEAAAAAARIASLDRRLEAIIWHARPASYVVL